MRGFTRCFNGSCEAIRFFAVAGRMSPTAVLPAERWASSFDPLFDRGAPVAGEAPGSEGVDARDVGQHVRELLPYCGARARAIATLREP